MGRIARPPADDQEASVYWEDKWDARGKHFKANEVSCAHRTEAFGTIFVVTNLDNDPLPGPRAADHTHAAGFSISRWAPRARSAAIACAASPCAAPAMSWAIDGFVVVREQGSNRLSGSLFFGFGGI